MFRLGRLCNVVNNQLSARCAHNIVPSQHHRLLLSLVNSLHPCRSPDKRNVQRHCLQRSYFVYQSMCTSSENQSIASDTNEGEDTELERQNTEDEEVDVTLPETFYKKFGVDHAVASDVIANLEGEELRKYKIVQLEHDVFLSTAVDVPEVMTDAMWVEILQKPSRSQRRKTYRYWFLTEKSAQNRRVKKLARAQEREAHLESVKNTLPPNTIMLKMGRRRVRDWCAHKFVHTFQQGPQLALDLDYDAHMNRREIVRLSEQVLEGYGFNRTVREPFHIHLVNARPDTATVQQLRRTEKEVALEDYLWSMNEGDLTDVFPPEKIVYLSPNAERMLETIDEDKVYVIGGLVDLSENQPHSLGKAKRLGLEMRKLPIDRVVKIRQGNKVLTIDQMMKIIISFRETGDWSKTLLTHLPSRKIDHDFMEGRGHDRFGPKRKERPWKPRYEDRGYKSSFDDRSRDRSNRRDSYGEERDDRGKKSFSR